MLVYRPGGFSGSWGGSRAGWYPGRGQQVRCGGRDPGWCGVDVRLFFVSADVCTPEGWPAVMMAGSYRR